MAKLSALMKKNFILMKRSCFGTFCEVLIPPLLMLIILWVRTLIDKEDTAPPSDFNTYVAEKSIVAAGGTDFYGLPKNKDFVSCLQEGPEGKANERRTSVGVFNKNSLTDAVYQRLKDTFQEKVFQTEEEMDEYAGSSDHGKDAENPLLCFGFSLSKTGTNYSYTLKFFGPEFAQDTIEDIPTTTLDAKDAFQVLPSIDDFQMWRDSGYLMIMKYIGDQILRDSTGKADAEIDFAVLPQKYDFSRKDDFGTLLSAFMPLFYLISGMIPLTKYVGLFVTDKEKRIKEGMKIMGLGEGNYFLSYFLTALIFNIYYSIVMSLIIFIATDHINFFVLILINFSLFLSIFGLVYFFQSLNDSSRVATIFSAILYFVFFFFSNVFNGDGVNGAVKVIVSIFPPCAFSFGIETLGKFEASFRDLDFSTLFETHWDYSVGAMILMLLFDFVLYLFLGFYFQNVLKQQYGLSRPWYFLFTSEYWSNAPSSTKVSDATENTNLIQNNPESFQDESAYKEKLASGDCLQVKELRKQFGSGKLAVDGLSVNMYQNEIFALLGHNGAGKSTTISILSGLYDASGGQAFYQKYNVLSNMDEFRTSLGICPQHDVLFENLTVREHLSMYCDFKGVDPETKDSEIDKTIKDLELEEIEHRLSKALSGGQKRKLSIAIALIGGSKVVFLDEPTSGMDITNRRKLWDILKNCVDGRIVILTTHYMEEAAILGNRIGIMSGGKLKCCGNALFLINKFGTHISLTVSMEEDALKDKIISFCSDRIAGIEYTALKEEILFTIPKNNDIDLKSFFEDLDENKTALKIKNYGASMPTLEDVFINTSEDKKNMKEGAEDKGFKGGQITRELTTSFGTHLYQSNRKRWIQIVRDVKILVLDLIGPILLTLCGAIATKISFIKDSPPRVTSLDSIFEDVKHIPFASEAFTTSSINPTTFFTSTTDVKYESVTVNKVSSFVSTLDIFLTSIKGQTYNDVIPYGAYYLIESNDTDRKYKFVAATDLTAQDAPIIYANHMINLLVDRARGSATQITFNNNPFPLEIDTASQVSTGSNARFPFFAGIGFGIIASNIVGMLVRERNQNVKQLQIISGMSHYGYWVSNYIFEFIKYYIYCIFAIIIGYTLTDFEDFWMIFVLFGIAMIPYFYILSFFFKDESSAQNIVLLVCYVGGAIAGNIFINLRLFESTRDAAVRLSWLLRLTLPNFSFSFGMNMISSHESVMFAEEGKGYKSLNLSEFDFNYAGADIMMMLVWAILGPVLLMLLQVYSHRLSAKGESSDPDAQTIQDQGVIDDIKRAKTNPEDFSVQLRNVEKIFKTGGICGKEEKVAIDKLNLCLERGECFAFLGINGAGKSTTFKTLTMDVIPNSGEIFIQGKDLHQNFNELRKKIGYCPQTDSFFFYMTVRENLEFFCAIKGLNPEETNATIEMLMGAMNIHQYENTISGELSGGNKRKLSVAIALIGEPDLILLDEPSAGMDPEARRFMWSIINKVTSGENKSTVILTTHSMEEAETLCRRVGILVKGQFQTLGTFQNVKSIYGEGFEIDMTFISLSNEEQSQILNKIGLSAGEEVSLDELVGKLKASSFSAFADHLQPGKLGNELMVESKIKGKVSVERVASWLKATSNAWNCLSELLGDFPDISIIEYYGNNFKAKIYSEGAQSKTIGYLFGKFEEMVLY